jgi:heptosyltransferase-2
MSSTPFIVPDCLHFTGYKPCFPGKYCLDTCVDPRPAGTRILLINLDAMGNVLVTTSILPAIKRKYPVSHITWLTLKNAAPLLRHNPLVDRVMIWEPESWLVLQALTFDLLMNVDKSQRSCALAMNTRATEKLGFGLNERGQIIPLNPEAEENYRLGLDDNMKFRVNQKTVPQLECEEFRLDYRRDPYLLPLAPEEETFTQDYAQEHGLDRADLIVGFNTGCSELYPNKKMTIEQHVDLLRRLSGMTGVRLVLLGGSEDTVRNAEIARRAGAGVLNTPTMEGVRRGLCYINLCDVVITGDSFGMHAAVGLKKFVIVWFGLSCWTEVDLFDRGVKMIPHGLHCAPCWKKACPYNLECIQMIDLDAIVGHVRDQRERRMASAV